MPVNQFSGVAIGFPDTTLQQANLTFQWVSSEGSIWKTGMMPGGASFGMMLEWLFEKKDLRAGILRIYSTAPIVVIAAECVPGSPCTKVPVQ